MNDETRRMDRTSAPDTTEQRLQLHEEELVPHKEMQEVGTVTIRTEIEERPERFEIEALREEVEIEHLPAGEEVRAREEPREENGAYIVPVYEEQLVVSKRLILKERLRITRVSRTEKRIFEDTLRHERAVVEHPENTPLVNELYPEDNKRKKGGLFGL
ncbi:MAG: YsnF/AvaK domain-containing protein [Candidatus Limnocylindria bacterium]